MIIQNKSIENNYEYTDTQYALNFNLINNNYSNTFIYP